MSETQEARTELVKQLPTKIVQHIMKFADAYALVAHVAACEKMEIGDEGYTGKHCGDDNWYCNNA